MKSSTQTVMSPSGIYETLLILIGPRLTLKMLSVIYSLTLAQMTRRGRWRRSTMRLRRGVEIYKNPKKNNLSCFFSTGDRSPFFSRSSCKYECECSSSLCFTTSNIRHYLTTIFSKGNNSHMQFSNAMIFLLM